MRKVIQFPLTRLLIWIGIMYPVYVGLSHSHLPWRIANWLLAVGAALAAMFVGRVIEGRPLREVGFGVRSMGRDMAAGFGLAGLMMGATIGVMALCGWYRITSFPGNWQAVGILFISYFFTALVEEVAMRGVVFRIVEESLGSWIGLGLNALIFGLMHLGNPNATLTAALAISAEAGILMTAAFMLTRSLWLTIGIHWGWNFFQGPVFGTPVSGGSGPALVHTAITGPTVATGGAFGPEAGLVALVIGTAVGVWLLVRAARRGQVVAPFWRRRPAPAPAAAPEVISRG